MHLLRIAFVFALLVCRVLVCVCVRLCVRLFMSYVSVDGLWSCVCVHVHVCVGWSECVWTAACLAFGRLLAVDTRWFRSVLCQSRPLSLPPFFVFGIACKLASG